MSAPDFKTAYRRIMDDHFPGGMEISFVGEDGRQTLVYEKATWVIDGEEKGLRYGENPGQEAALYRLVNGNLVAGRRHDDRPGTLPGLRHRASAVGQAPGKDQHHGRRQRAEHPALLRPTPCAIIVKHNNPCGAAQAARSRRPITRRTWRTGLPLSAGPSR